MFLLQVDCGQPMAPTNGTVSVSNGTQYGAEVYFDCDVGFRLDGNKSSVCQFTGQWEPKPLTCQFIGDYYFWQEPLRYIFEMH